MFKPKLLRQDQGFTLVEVLVSILIATVFTATALQAMVIATISKARARQYAEATTWIQQNLENTKSQATITNLAHENDDASTATVNEKTQRCGTSATSSSVSNGYAAALQARLSGLNTAKSATIESKTYTALANTTDEPNPRPVGGAKLWLLRNATNTTTAPYNVLEVSYAVVRDVNGSPPASPATSDTVASLYTEVIPDAAFQCP